MIKRPDMTFAVNWALNINDLSVYYDKPQQQQPLFDLFPDILLGWFFLSSEPVVDFTVFYSPPPKNRQLDFIF